MSTFNYKSLTEFYKSRDGRKFLDNFLSEATPNILLILTDDYIGVFGNIEDNQYIQFSDDENYYLVSKVRSKLLIGSNVVQQFGENLFSTDVKLDEFKSNANGLSPSEYEAKIKSDLMQKSAKEQERTSLARTSIQMYINHRCDSRIKNPYVNALLKLFSKLIVNDLELFTDVVCGICDYSPIISFYLCFEPFKKKPHIISSKFISSDDNMDIDDDDREVLIGYLGTQLTNETDLDLYMLLLSKGQIESKGLLNSKEGRDQVYSDIDELRIKCMKRGVTKQSVINLLSSTYESIEKNNKLSTGMIYSDRLHAIYKATTGLKLWQDELRLLIFNKESQFSVNDFNGFDRLAYIDLVNYVMTSKPCRNIKSEISFMDATFTAEQFVSSSFTLLHSTDFIYYFQPLSEIKKPVRPVGNLNELYAPMERGKRHPIINLSFYRSRELMSENSMYYTGDYSKINRRILKYLAADSRGRSETKDDSTNRKRSKSKTKHTDTKEHTEDEDEHGDLLSQFTKI